MISGEDRLRLGAESTLTCSVSGVYPAELLTLTWLRGDAVLQSIVGGPGSSSVQSEYRFAPVKQDSGANISCRATLDLQDLPAEDRTRETSVPLNLLCECSSVLQSCWTRTSDGKDLILCGTRMWILVFPVLRPGPVRFCLFMLTSLLAAIFPGGHEEEEATPIGGDRKCTIS